MLVARWGLDRGRWVRLDGGIQIQNPSIRSDYGHIGAVADAIAAAGIDTSRWLGHEIDNRLNRDNQDRRWNAPDKIRRPIAYLRARLAALDWSGPSPSELERAKLLRAASGRRHVKVQPVNLVPDDSPGRRAAREAAKSRGVYRQSLFQVRALAVRDSRPTEVLASSTA
ncbi:hypothetical protein [Nocardia nova]|uniref:hypothetical protein n=1 Tax=Nocardia nova TaxID=37330 RepID=UPI003400ABD5